MVRTSHRSKRARLSRPQVQERDTEDSSSDSLFESSFSDDDDDTRRAAQSTDGAEDLEGDVSLPSDLSDSSMSPTSGEEDSITKKRPKKGRMPSESAKLRSWRRLVVEEREQITGLGGLVWEQSRSLLPSLTSAQRSHFSEAVTRALAHSDATLAKTLVPPQKRAGVVGGGGAALPSSFLGWRGELTALNAESGDESVASDDAVGQLGFAADIRRLEELLTPEAAEVVALSRALALQQERLSFTESALSRAERRRIGRDVAEARAGERDLSDEEESQMQELHPLLQAAARAHRVAGPPVDLNLLYGEASWPSPHFVTSATIIHLSPLMEVLRRSHPRKVAIHVVEQRAHVWEADDVAFIRREHHICGLMTGTLPAVQQQNVFLGIPQQLFPEEVVYLMRAGAAFIVDDVAAHCPSSEGQRRKHWAEYEADAESQRQDAHQKSLERGKEFEENLLHLTSNDVGGDNSPGNGLNERQVMAARKAVEKRQRREAAKKDADKQKEVDGENGVSGSQKVQSEAVTTQVENRKDIAVALGHSHLTEGGSSSSLWYRPMTEGSTSSLVSVYETLSSALKAGVWHYPRTASERSRCSVFEDLQSKGFYMGVGLRFGGDFVVYPGDPMRYHSHFTASVQGPAQAISGLELVGAGRLGTAVKKAHLLCGSSLDEVKAEEDVVLSGRRDSKESSSWGHVDYYSLTWAGFGT